MCGNPVLGPWQGCVEWQLLLHSWKLTPVSPIAFPTPKSQNAPHLPFGEHQGPVELLLSKKQQMGKNTHPDLSIGYTRGDHVYP